MAVCSIGAVVDFVGRLPRRRSTKHGPITTCGWEHGTTVPSWRFPRLSLSWRRSDRCDSTTQPSIGKVCSAGDFERSGTEALVPDSEEWYSMMAAVWLPKGDHSELQKHLWMQHGIEVPINRFGDRFLVRVSCHLYNTQPQIDLLVDSSNRISFAKLVQVPST